MSLDSATWAALALVLTLVGAALSFLAWRRRGLASGLRGLAWTLVPVAAWLTGTLRLAVDIVDDVSRWASRLVFSPTVWLGLAVGGVAIALWFLSGAMLARAAGARETGTVGGTKSRNRVGQRPAAGKPLSRKNDPEDDDMADIEAILKKHGI